MSDHHRMYVLVHMEYEVNKKPKVKYIQDELRNASEDMLPNNNHLPRITLMHNPAVGMKYIDAQLSSQQSVAGSPRWQRSQNAAESKQPMSTAYS